MHDRIFYAVHHAGHFQNDNEIIFWLLIVVIAILIVRR